MLRKFRKRIAVLTVAAVASVGLVAATSAEAYVPTNNQCTATENSARNLGATGARTNCIITQGFGGGASGNFDGAQVQVEFNRSCYREIWRSTMRWNPYAGDYSWPTNTYRYSLIRTC